MRAVPISAAALLGAMLLSACSASSPADFDRRMATFVAGPEIQLVSSLGVPHQVYEVEGRRFLRYDLSSGATAPSISPSIGFGFGGGSWGHGGGVGTGIGFGFGGAGVPAEPCVVTFEVRDGRVLNFERQGEGCR
ncbi:hypothetical protein E0493_05290 [Roseomonas sp. M0104]|uniref:Lipoprotein n=1 Tax=Teichococcus coralli TaxID=2545983 RepID=A0A845B7T5_9PROT|nr:hypothetical protein [Pseudoroseomonas coralli]MXP62765.1 hypothetical protein [Pseudoroseomonas coralli]